MNDKFIFNLLYKQSTSVSLLYPDVLEEFSVGNDNSDINYFFSNCENTCLFQNWIKTISSILMSIIAWGVWTIILLFLLASSHCKYQLQWVISAKEEIHEKDICGWWYKCLHHWNFPRQNGNGKSLSFTKC